MIKYEDANDCCIVLGVLFACVNVHVLTFHLLKYIFYFSECLKVNEKYEYIIINTIIIFIFQN